MSTHDFDLGVLIPPQARQRIAPYVRIPIEWVCKAQKIKGAFSLAVVLMIWYRRSVTGVETVTLSNALATEFGLTRKQKASGLNSLVQAGLVSVEQLDGRSPRVTLINPAIER